MTNAVQWAIAKARWRAVRWRDAARVTPLPDVVVDIEVDQSQIVLRAPRVGDFDQWRAARLREQKFMEPFWAPDERAWADRHKTGDWLEVVALARAGRRDWSRLLSVLVVDGKFSGQLNLEYIDTDRSVAEFGAWIVRGCDPALSMRAVVALADYAAVELGIQTVLAPIDPSNDRAVRAAQRSGFHFVGPIGDGVHDRYERCRRTEGAENPERITEFGTSRRLQAQLHRLVPGGAHTYARGEDQYPDGMAPVLRSGLGAHVTDVDGNEFIEYGAGLRSVTLGHAYRPVTDAVIRVLSGGNNFSRPTELELLAAQDFIEMVPTAEMVKFAKNGSDATTAAIRLARAVTGRTKIARCDQPFFSVDDWFIGSTPMNRGIPTPDTEAFAYNDLARVAEVLEHNAIAAVIMEPATAMAEPLPGFLEGVRDLCSRHGTLLIFDEMITGFRWSGHGAQGLYRVTPDLSCWGKALGNGFPISALAGRREVMELGGLNADSDRVFLLSTTHGPESSSLAAMRAVIAAYRKGDPIADMERVGRRLVDGINSAAEEYGVSDYLYAAGRASCAVFVTRDGEGQPSQAYRTLVLQEMLSRGILGQSLVVSAAHTDRDIDRTVEAFTEIMPTYRQAIDAGSVDGLLRGRPVAPAIRRTAHPKTPYLAKEFTP